LDLHIAGGEATSEEREAVDALLGPAESGWRGGPRVVDVEGRTSRGGVADVRARRDLLLPALHAVQDRVGWISRGALNYVCRRLTVPPADAWGVVTFYHLFRTEPTPPVVVHVCDDIACRLHGAERLCAELCDADEERPSIDGVRWQRSPCLGQCDRAPAALIVRAGREPSAEVVVHATSADDIVRALEPRASAPMAPPHVATLDGNSTAVHPAQGRLVRRVALGDPESLSSYRSQGGYEALALALEMGAERVIEHVIASSLLGRGGAAFPTGRKWAAVAREAEQPHYLVCNADESEPGTFKDRVLLEHDPFSIVEAMTIAGWATGCARGYLYVRGEYPLARQRVQSAIDAARAAGLIGANVLTRGVAFDIEVRRGAGAYICGEETALFNSLEGRRGEPRSKPPFPSQVGLFGKPTAVNNVETLVNVLDIVREGGAAWARTGTPASTGTRLYCVSGHVSRPGLYEVTFGRTLGDVLDAAGGVANGRPLRAVLLGGAAGTFVGPDALSMRLTFEDVRREGATLGSGVVMVFDDTADIGDALLRIARFMADESCGQCVPCRVGTVRQVEWLLRATRDAASGRRPNEADMQLLSELGQAMRDASICGLGQTASSAVESAISRLRVFS
jgi:NADH-quinone oxidoreductase subunit F